MKSTNSVLVSETLQVKWQIKLWIILTRVNSSFSHSSNTSHCVSPAKMKWKVPLYVGIPPARRHGHTAFILHSHVSVPLNKLKLCHFFQIIFIMFYKIYFFCVCFLVDSCLYLEGRMKSRSLMTWRWWNSLTPQRDNQVHYSFCLKVTLTEGLEGCSLKTISKCWIDP